MKAKIEQDQLTIDMRELVASMSNEHRKEFAQFMVFQDTLLEAVVDTVATGMCFEGGWWIGGLDYRLREKLMPLLPQTVQDLVTHLRQENERLASQVNNYWHKFADVLSRWPQGTEKPNDSYYHGEYRPWTPAEIDAWLGENLPPGEWEAIKAKYAAMKAEEPVIA